MIFLLKTLQFHQIQTIDRQTIILRKVLKKVIQVINH